MEDSIDAYKGINHKQIGLLTQPCLFGFQLAIRLRSSPSGSSHLEHMMLTIKVIKSATTISIGYQM
jgi:hypothetical protein